MAHAALDPIERVIAALTYDDIEQIEVDQKGVETVSCGNDAPLLDRSISADLLMIGREFPKRAKLLRGMAAAIDEALLAAAEAQDALGKVQA